MNTPKNIVILSGAGMSAESGIPTFRGADGLWEGHRIEEVATPEAWESNPQLVFQFYNERRRHLMDAEPNKGHQIVANWQRHASVHVITQNVDDLHELAGSSHVLHLHGELMKARSTGPGAEVYPVSQWEMTPEDRCPSGYPVRPHIVWFGEAVPMMDEALPIVRTADAIVVIGTSMQVYPAAQLVFEAQPGASVYVIDPAAENLPAGMAERIAMGGADGLSKLNNRWFR